MYLGNQKIGKEKAGSRLITTSQGRKEEADRLVVVFFSFFQAARDNEKHSLLLHDGELNSLFLVEGQFENSIPNICEIELFYLFLLFIGICTFSDLTSYDCYVI